MSYVVKDGVSVNLLQELVSGPGSLAKGGVASCCLLVATVALLLTKVF